MNRHTVLSDAVWALDVLGHGDDPGYAGAVSALSAIEALQEDPPASMNPSELALLNTAHELLTSAVEGECPFNSVDSIRALGLARKLRDLQE